MIFSGEINLLMPKFSFANKFAFKWSNMAKNEHLNVFVCPIYNFETVKSKYFLYPHWVHQAQMGAVKALGFMHHFYVLLLLFFSG